MSLANDISGVFTPMFVPSSASAVGSSIGSAVTAPFSPGGAAQMNAQKTPGILELVFGSSADSQKSPNVQPSNGGGFAGNVSSPAVDYLNADLAKKTQQYRDAGTWWQIRAQYYVLHKK